ncbi:MAG: TonB-dependent receptor [Bacteroides sp.]|jgi:hypothetical protein|nr:TonB-dependent receptor [Bacteroides sp.]
MIIYRNIFVLLFFVTITGFLSSPSFSQGTPLQTPEELTAAQAIHLLEQKHGTRIFFKEEWFGDVSYSGELLDLPLPDALTRLTRGHRLNLVTLDGMIFLVPDEGGQLELAPSEDQIVVGNPSEYGRFSKATLTGRILDGSTGEPLMGAVLYETETGAGASSNFDGYFRMELPVGDLRLRISYVGYEDRYQQIRLISPGNVEFDLFSSSTQLEAFTITAQRAEENISRTQMSMINLDAQAIKELPGTFGERDIVRSITLMPGIQSVGEFGTGFNVRGGGADQNLILLENVPLFNSSHLFGLISVVNPDLVNSLSLIKAGTPARFGERASSVMDIRLGKGLDKEKTTIMGGIGLLNSRLLFETPIIKEKITFSFGARTSYSDWFLQKIPNDDLLNSSAGFFDLTGTLNAALGPKNRLTLFGYHSADRFGFGGDTDYNYQNTLASLRLNSAINARLSSTFILGMSNYNYLIEETPDINPYIHQGVNSSIDYYNLKWFFSWLPVPDHKIEFGINGFHYGIEPGIMKPIGDQSLIDPKTMDREQALELAAFISDEIVLTERINLELGLRFTQYLQLGPGKSHLYEENMPRLPENIIDTLWYDSNEVMASYNGLEPRAGLRFNVGETSSVKLSFSRINQYINLISNTSVMAPADIWKLSDRHLKPLRSDQYAVGYFRNFLDNSIETSVEAYFKQLHNAIEYKSGAEIALNDYLETDIINAEGYNYGLEFYVRKNAGRLTGWTSYTWSASRVRSASPYAESQINGNEYFPSNFDRPHNLVINANYHISRRWRLAGTFTYNTGRPITLPEHTFLQGSNQLIYYSDRNKYRLPDYHRLDISITLDENLRVNRRGKGSWTVSIMNLYGRKNPFSVFYKKQPTGLYEPRSFKLYQLYIIGRPLPTLTYNFSF